MTRCDFDFIVKYLALAQASFVTLSWNTLRFNYGMTVSRFCGIEDVLLVFSESGL